MSFSEYRKYSARELKQIFNLKIVKGENLFNTFKSIKTIDRPYPVLQDTVKKMQSRIGLSKSDNEATRGNLLVSRILWEASDRYNLGIFFEPGLEIAPEETPNLPHPLNGKYDCALCLDDIDFVSPIVAIVEVKRSSLADGLGQCVAEMYATLLKFKQDKVYGIITDGEVWSFFLLQDLILSVNESNYYLSNVADIVDRIGYLAETFKSLE